MANLIGIQFDSDEISLAQYTGGSIRMYSERMPENLVKDEEIVSIETFAAFLKEVRYKGGFTGRNCAVALPFSGAYFRTLNMPVMTEDQLELNLPYEFRDFIGQDSFKYNFDYAVNSYVYDADGKPETINIIAAAASKDMLERYALALKKAGFRLKVAIPTEMSLINIARSAAKRGAVLEAEECLCSIGMDHTVFSIIRNGELAAFQVIDIGCSQVDAVIAELKGVDPYLAASYRESDFENVLDEDGCRRVYERLGLEIMKTVNFYKYENPDTTVSTITCIGNCSWMGDRLDAALQFSGLERKNISEWLPVGEADEALSERCALAIGAVSTDD